MKSKFILLLMGALLTLTLTFVASAQREQNVPNILPLRTKVTLQCAPGQGKDASTPLYIKNPTAQDVAAGTVIYWSAKQDTTTTGKQPSPGVVKKNNGNQVELIGPADNITSCQAWTYK